MPPRMSKEPMKKRPATTGIPVDANAIGFRSSPLTGAGLHCASAQMPEIVWMDWWPPYKVTIPKR